MSPEQAMLDVSDLLIAKNLDDDVKKEAAKMFEENMGIQLNWPLVFLKICENWEILV